MPTTKTKTTWQCAEGHTWEAPYGSIQQGHGCPRCAGMAPKTPADYHTLAQSRGFKWLGPEVSNVKTRTTWQCAERHTWEASHDGLQGCPYCSGKAPKTPADYHTLAQSRGFKWLGPEVSNVKTRTTWQCSKGHKWEASHDSLQGCPHCYGNARKPPQNYHSLASERGYIWLGPEVPTTKTKTTWQCSEGHTWEAAYSSLQGCPHCYGNIPKTPADYHELASERGFIWLGPEVPNTSAKTTWQCSEGHTWEAAYSSLQGCLECAVYNKTNKPQDYHTLAQSRGFKWLGPEVPNVTTKTTWQCSKGHTWEAIYNSIQRGHGCPHCSSTFPKTPQDYHDLAQSRGFKWLGPEVSSVNAKTTWQCSEGHTWEAPYGSIQQGHGCPRCAGMARKTPQDYHELAESRGLKWLGPEVSNASTKTTWQCSKGHTWEAIYNSIRQGYGCHECADTRKTPQDYHDLAQSRGYIWLGPEVPNNATKTTWQCSKGHTWEAVHSSLQQGTGCPVCNESRGESKVAQVLDDLGIRYERQKTFPGLRHKKALRYDFYLPGQKTIIEYHGSQHYEPTNNNFFGGPQALAERQERDEVKARFASENGYKLIIIPYTDFDRIDEIIKALSLTPQLPT